MICNYYDGDNTRLSGCTVKGQESKGNGPTYWKFECSGDGKHEPLECNIQVGSGIGNPGDENIEDDPELKGYDLRAFGFCKDAM